MQPTVWSSKQPHVTCMHAVHQESWRRRQTNSIESRPRAFNQSICMTRNPPLPLLDLPWVAVLTFSVIERPSAMALH